MPGPARLRSLSVLALAGVACAVLADELITNRRGVRFTPAIVEPSEARLARLQVPDGFRVNVFADGLGEPRIMAVGNDGTVFVTRPSAGDVLALRDEDGDGRADSRHAALEGLPEVHGIALHDDRMFLATVEAVYRAPLQGARAGERTRIVGGLPPGGRHPNRTLAVGPDGRLYISVGSTCNACIEEEDESAAIIRVSLDGGDRTIFATGLRNTIGFGWHPTTGEMWGFDHGTDWLGDDTPPEELNRLGEGKDFGWPFLYGDNTLVQLQRYPDGFDRERAMQAAVPAVLGYTAHSAPMQMVFYDGATFPDEFRHDAFVAMRGSWNRKPPSGYEVIRVRFRDGRPTRVEPFLRGFLSPDGGDTFARPVGVAVASDGSLLVGDDTNGHIYRVSRAASR